MNAIAPQANAPTIVILPQWKMKAAKSQRVPLCGDFCFFFTLSVYYVAVNAFPGPIHVFFFASTHLMLLFILLCWQMWLRKKLERLTPEFIEELMKSVARWGHIRMFTSLYGFACIWLVIEKEEKFKFYVGVILSLVAVWYSGLMYCFHSGTSDLLGNLQMAVKREVARGNVRVRSRLSRID